MTIKLHPDRPKLEARLMGLGKSLDSKFEGQLFRFINPAYSKASDNVDGAGALHADGRWNLTGPPRLSYTAMAPETALAEALAHVRYYRLPLSKALPRVLVGLRLKAQRVLDLRDGKVRKALRLSEGTIKKLDWRAENQKGMETITQAWGRAFAVAGYEAVIVPSAADLNGTNVLVYPENMRSGNGLEVVTEVTWPGK